LAPHTLANLTKRYLPQLTALVNIRLKRMQYRPSLLDGFFASTRLDLRPFVSPTITVMVFSQPRSSLRERCITRATVSQEVPGDDRLERAITKPSGSP
jgi:hypothetical protein